MTVEEFAYEMNVSVAYVLNNWKALHDRALTRGIKVIKVGRGRTADYGILDFGKEDSIARFEFLGGGKDRYGSNMLRGK